MKARHELNACLFVQKTSGFQRQPYHMELEKYTAIQNGDMDAVRQSLSDKQNGLLSDQRQLSDHSTKNSMYHFVIAASAISKACMESGMGHDEAYTLADIYIRKADKCKDCHGLHKLYEEMQLDFAERMHEIKKQHVISLHVRKCIDYIYEHLSEPLTVNSLARLTGLNPSYLSKLFVKETGIHLKHFVTEAKLDTAQNLLKYSDLSYLDISTALGFSSQSAFVSVFRKATGTTPKKYREEFYVSRQ